MTAFACARSEAGQLRQHALLLPYASQAHPVLSPQNMNLSHLMASPSSGSAAGAKVTSKTAAGAAPLAVPLLTAGTRRCSSQSAYASCTGLCAAQARQARLRRAGRLSGHCGVMWLLSYVESV